MVGAAEFSHNGLALHAEPLTEGTGPVRLIWLHGWGQERGSLRGLAQSLLRLGEGWLIDLPGHGRVIAPAKETDASPAAIAQLLAAWLATLPPCPTLILGHSMGFRVALHAAAQDLPNLNGFVALAGAGIPRQLPLKKRLRKWLIGGAMQLGHHVKPWLGEGLLNALRTKFGSRDYLGCPAPLRPMFIQVVRDDATALLPQITTPALLLYGAEDEDTPPDIGQTLQRRLPHATLHVLPYLNHYTLLTRGQPVVAQKIQEWLSGLAAARQLLGQTAQ